MYSKQQVLEASKNYFKGDDLAANVFVSKYALKNKEGEFLELTPDDMHKRLAKEFARIEQKYPNPLSEEEIYNLFKDFRYIVPQGSPMAGIGNDFQIMSLSNCFVVGNKYDSYSGIMRIDEELAQVFKRRGGCGIDISHIRPSGIMANGAILQGDAGSTLYMDRFSNTTREVAQNGRRGALIITMHIKHPDIEKFIDKKLVEGKVTGANISVKLTDEFMECVVENKDFIQSFPINFDTSHFPQEYIDSLKYNEIVKFKEGYIKKIKARQIWDKIIKNAWKSAEPGILFWDQIIRESPADCYEGFESHGTNPCVTGDTIVAVADGRNGVAIKELCDTTFPVYSAKINKSFGDFNKRWKSEIKSAKAFKTGTKKVIKIVLSNGSFFECTEDHLLALHDKSYVLAKDSLGCELEKFYSFSDKNTCKSYRHINTKSNGNNRQYRMIWEYYNGHYCGDEYNIDHKDDDSTNDSIDNLSLLTTKEHKLKTKRFGIDNPIQKIKGSEYLSLYTSRTCIYANAKKYKWNEDRLNKTLQEWDEKNLDKLNELKPKDLNVYFDEDIYVIDIIDENKIVDVYDLSVEDNHNFYIITKTDDDKFLNSSGVLIHNCSELPLSRYDSCRLIAINLYSYVNNPFESGASFDYDLFIDHVIKAQRLCDDLIDLEIEKIDKILAKVKSDPEPEFIKRNELILWEKIKQSAIKGRRTGLGITGEGDMLAALGVIYGSEKSIEVGKLIHSILATASYVSSITMAKERGCFEEFDFEREKNHIFINRILLGEGEQIFNDWKTYGRRNIANLTIPPAGSISTLTQTTSGIEPLFCVSYKRRRKINDKTKAVFVDSTGDIWEEYNVLHDKFKIWYDKNWFKVLGYNYFDIDYKPDLEIMSQEEINKLFKKSPYYLATAQDLDWVQKVKLQGEIQKYIDHSISATTNIPATSSLEMVQNIYMTAWKYGCKGHTIYRDGCRDGVLLTSDNKKAQFNHTEPHKRPKEVQCDVYFPIIKKVKYIVMVGLIESKPYEVFAFKVNGYNIDDNISKGYLQKVKSGHYNLIDFEKNIIVEDIVSKFEVPEEEFCTRLISTSLRHGTPIYYIVEQLNKSYGTLVDFSKVIARQLKKYIIEGTKTSESCPNCDTKMIFENGCVICKNCGYSKCG